MCTYWAGGAFSYDLITCRASKDIIFMIPTVWDDDTYPTAGQMTGGIHQTVADAPPPEKKPEPLPSFHNRPRVYKRDGTFEEK